MTGRIIRPKATVLPDSALLSKPFTHQVVAAQPYYGAEPAAATPPGGVFAAGTRVRLVQRGRGPYCRVADQRGAPCYTAFAGLRPLARR